MLLRPGEGRHGGGGAVGGGGHVCSWGYRCRQCGCEESADSDDVYLVLLRSVGLVWFGLVCEKENRGERIMICNLVGDSVHLTL